MQEEKFGSREIVKYYFLVLSLLLAGCDFFSETGNEERNIETEIQEHLQTFKDEAAARGLNVDELLDSIRIEFVDEIEFNEKIVCGISSWDENRYPGVLWIQISGNIPCWLNRAKEDNEALIFHHLGHLVLNRSHSTRVFASGHLPSIMVSKVLPKFYTGLLTNRRPYYMSELFNPRTPNPDWGG